MGRVTRRTLIAGGAALAFSRAAYGSAFDTDVLVVGAGAAGLAAAHELKRLGRSFVLVEAGGRAGGRLHTDVLNGAAYDAGARYIHWAERNPWTEVARELKWPTQPDAPRGAFRFFDRGALQPAAAREPRRAAFRRVSYLLDGDDVADVSVIEAAVAADPALGEAAEGLARFGVGEEPQRVSARDYARLWSGPDLVLPNGYGALAQAWAGGLPLRLDTRVEKIDWSGQGVVATTSAGTISARACIVTVSVGVLKSGALRFTPELPQHTQSALGGIEMGALSKVGLSFDFAKLDVPDGDIFTREADGGAFNFDVRPFGRDIVVAVFGGDFARRIARTDAEAIDAALDALAACVGSSVRAAFRQGRAHAWFRDPYALGCYSHCLPGRAAARAALAGPVADRIFLAGEATGEIGGAMTAGGAALAGRAAARKAAAG